VEQLTYEEFVAQHSRYDDLVAASSLVDRYCSSSYWILPAHQAFNPSATVLVLHDEQGYFVACRPKNRPELLLPFENSWCFSSPLVGNDRAQLVAAVWDALAAESWKAWLVTGLDNTDPAWDRLCKLAALAGCKVTPTRTTVRCVASLAGGLPGYLSRRSGRFRRNVLREQRRAGTAGIVFEDHAPTSATAASQLFQRIVAIEHCSWKGVRLSGFESGSMRDFYAAGLPLLGDAGRLRSTLAYHRDQPIGAIFGGIFAGTYRGLQLTYAMGYEEHGVGNLLQLHTLERLVDEGIEHYDLGIEMPYKAAWAEHAIATHAVLVERPRTR
jgi:hypothetical protein